MKEEKIQCCNIENIFFNKKFSNAFLMCHIEIIICSDILEPLMQQLAILYKTSNA